MRHDGRLKSQIQSQLDSVERRRISSDGHDSAAVCLLVHSDGLGEAGLLLTRRSRQLHRHPGQWALPGGRVDRDETAEQAALRELAEEVGIETADILGFLDDQPTRSGFVITPVVVWAESTVEPRPSRAEVTSVHFLGLAELSRAEPRWLAPDGTGAEILQMPLLGTNIHAPTGAILLAFSELALRGRHTDLRRVGIPAFVKR